MLPATWLDAARIRHRVMIAHFNPGMAVIILEDGSLQEVYLADLQVDWHYDKESGIWSSDWEEIDETPDDEPDAEG